MLRLHHPLLLQRRHQDVQGVRILGLRRQQQQLRLHAELHGRVCQRCVLESPGGGDDDLEEDVVQLKVVLFLVGGTI